MPEWRFSSPSFQTSRDSAATYAATAVTVVGNARPASYGA
jgi:hypothetical protein